MALYGGVGLARHGAERGLDRLAGHGREDEELARRREAQRGPAALGFHGTGIEETRLARRGGLHGVLSIAALVIER